MPRVCSFPRLFRSKFASLNQYLPGIFSRKSVIRYHVYTGESELREIWGIRQEVINYGEGFKLLQATKLKLGAKFTILKGTRSLRYTWARLNIIILSFFMCKLKPKFKKEGISRDLHRWVHEKWFQTLQILWNKK